MCCWHVLQTLFCTRFAAQCNRQNGKIAIAVCQLKTLLKTSDQCISQAACSLQPLAYMALHVTLTGATFAVCKVWWNYYHAHTVFLLAILCVSAWNGASYYFEVFAHRYVETVGLPTKPTRMKKKQ